jgi:hypothetical protein
VINQGSDEKLRYSSDQMALCLAHGRAARSPRGRLEEVLSSILCWSAADQTNLPKPLQSAGEPESSVPQRYPES